MGCAERAGDVSAALGEREAALPVGVARALERRPAGKPEASGERLRQPLGWMVAALAGADPVGRNEGDETGIGRRQAVGEDRGGVSGEPPQAVLLPTRDEPPHRHVVGDGRARPGECKPSARALPAARNGTNGRRPAEIAPRWPEERQIVPAGPAQLRSAAAADEAPLRQQQVEHAPTLTAGV